jgi:hypothetical protein
MCAPRYGHWPTWGERNTTVMIKIRMIMGILLLSLATSSLQAIQTTETNNQHPKKKNNKIHIDCKTFGSFLNFGIEFKKIFFWGTDGNFDNEKLKKGIELEGGYGFEVSLAQIVKLIYEILYREEGKKFEPDSLLSILFSNFIEGIHIITKISKKQEWNLVTELIAIFFTAIFIGSAKLTFSWIKIHDAPGSVLVVGYSLNPINNNVLPLLLNLLKSKKLEPLVTIIQDIFQHVLFVRPGGKITIG